MSYIDRTSYIIAFFSFVISWVLFYYDSGDIWMSFGVALMAAFCIWVTYVLLRLVYLAIKS